jgi:DNA polymerase-1
VFVAPEGFVLLVAGHPDIELRILAHLTHDESLLEAFCTPGSSVDLRRRTAAAALAIPEEHVTTSQLNKFGRLIERGQAFRLSDLDVASELDIAVERAEEIIGRLLARFPGVRQWIAATEEAAEAESAARSLYGRRRTFWLSDDDLLDGAEHSPELREAVDFCIEATAADILKSKLAGLYEALPADCRLLLPLEDGVLMEVPKGQVKQVAKIVRQVMEEPPPDFSVPLRVKLSRGKSWAECKAPPQRAASSDGRAEAGGA